MCSNTFEWPRLSAWQRSPKSGLLSFVISTLKIHLHQCCLALHGGAVMSFKRWGSKIPLSSFSTFHFLIVLGLLRLRVSSELGRCEPWVEAPGFWNLFPWRKTFISPWLLSDRWFVPNAGPWHWIAVTSKSGLWVSGREMVPWKPLSDWRRSSPKAGQDKSDQHTGTGW